MTPKEAGLCPQLPSMLGTGWGLGIRNLNGFYWRLVWRFEWDSQGLAFIQGREQMMGACISEGLQE